MKSSLLFVIVFFFLLTSCKYSLLVNKRYIVKDVKGYLVFRKSEVTFYSFKDTIDAHFLADNHKDEGYRVGFDTYWIDSLSKDYSHLMFIRNDTKLSIIPVELRYYLGDVWQEKDEQNMIEYKWNNEIKTLRFKQHDWRNMEMDGDRRKG